MAWTTPKTFVDGYELTATELNMYLRDDMLELNAAKASTAAIGSYFITDAPHSQVARLWDTPSGITADETYFKSEYGDCATVGPIATVTSGTTCLVIMSALLRSHTGSTAPNNVTATNVSARMSFEVSGATEIAATDNYALCMMTNASNTSGSATPTYPMQWSQYTWVDNLTPGVNTFTCKYRVGVEGVEGHFQMRRLYVFPFS